LSQNRLHPHRGAFPPTLKFVKLHLPLGSPSPSPSFTFVFAYRFKSGVLGTVGGSAMDDGVQTFEFEVGEEDEGGASLNTVSH
jgi:hypothetical protein